MRRRYPVRGGQQGGSADLFGDLARVLLWGWGAQKVALPGISEHVDEFRIFDYDDRALSAAWTRHKSALLREWHRRGESGQPWGATFDAIERVQ